MVTIHEIQVSFGFEFFLLQMLLKPCTKNCGIKFGKYMAKYDRTIAIFFRLLIDLKIKRMICYDYKGNKPQQTTIIEDI